MNITVNLARPTKKIKRRISPLLIISVLFFSIIVVSFLLIIVNGIINLRLTDLNSDEENLIDEISVLTDRRINYLVTKQKLGVTEDVLASRSRLDERLRRVLDTFESDPEVERVDLNDNALGLRFLSTDLSTLNTLVEERILGVYSDASLGVERVDLKSFGIDKNSEKYFADVSIEFGEL